MCLHLTLPGSSATTVGCPKKERKINYEVQTVWKSLTTENVQYQKPRNFKFVKISAFWKQPNKALKTYKTM